jgi:hypothetical protein
MTTYVNPRIGHHDHYSDIILTVQQRRAMLFQYRWDRTYGHATKASARHSYCARVRRMQDRVRAA